jgi:hypothetical protein
VHHVKEACELPDVGLGRGRVSEPELNGEEVNGSSYGWGRCVLHEGWSKVDNANGCERRVVETRERRSGNHFCRPVLGARTIVQDEVRGVYRSKELVKVALGHRLDTWKVKDAVKRR